MEIKSEVDEKDIEIIAKAEEKEEKNDEGNI